MSNQNRVLKVGEQVETTLRSWEFGKTQGKGTKYLRLNFNGYIQKNLWLWSSPKAIKQGMEILKILGFKGKDVLMCRAEGSLDTSKVVLVTIDEVTNKNGKHYYSASWVNDPDKVFGGFQENDKMTKDELDEFSMDTSSYIEDAQDIEPPAATQDYKTEDGFTADNIPF